MKVGIFQDIHANLPAFKKGIDFFTQKKCEKIYHVGDLIGIGPYPREVLTLSLKIKDLVLIMGNHDEWYANGLSNTKRDGMGEEEYNHQKWTHNQIGEEFREFVKEWKYVEELIIADRVVKFQHYGLDKSTNKFKSFLKEINEDSLYVLFGKSDAEMIFYGHKHEASDILGQSRYVNLGSAGCFDKSEVRLGILNLEDDKLSLQKFSLKYEDDGLMEEFDKRKVPARDFIRQTFITR